MKKYRILVVVVCVALLALILWYRTPSSLNGYWVIMNPKVQTPEQLAQHPDPDAMYVKITRLLPDLNSCETTLLYKGRVLKKLTQKATDAQLASEAPVDGSGRRIWRMCTMTMGGKVVGFTEFRHMSPSETVRYTQNHR